jgi:hypothetical protein
MRLLNRFFGGLLVFLLIIIPFFDITPVQAVASFQRSITISNTSGATQTNFQVSIVLDTASLILAGKMRSDCGDIRFYDTNGTTLLGNYWVDGCNLSTTRIWVKKPSIATGTSTIFLKYGDSTLTSLSSGINTMEKYDTFQTTPTCTLKNTAVYDSVNKWVQLTANAGSLNGECEYNYNPGQGFYAKYDFWSGGGNGADSNWLYAYESATPINEDVRNKGYHFTFDEYQSRICFTKSTTDNGACIAQSATVSNIANSTWHTAEIFHSNLAGSVYMDGTLYASGSDTAATSKTSNLFGIGARTGGQFNEHRFRSFIVAKYLATVITTLNAEAQVSSSLAFAIRNSNDLANTNSCDFGNVSTTSTASCLYRLKITSDAANGYNVFVTTSGNLKNGSKSIANATIGAGGSGGTLISTATLGSEAYGVLLNPGTLTASGAIIKTTAYNAGLVNAVNFVTTASQNIISSTGRNSPLPTDTANTILVNHLLNIAADTSAGEYTQNVTYTIIANY